MVPAPIPDNENDRLAALRELLILDTPPEERFDRVVRFLAEEFDIPMALVSLVDGDRQWFKASVGLAVCETPRETSFCGHAVAQPDGPLVVPDALADERFFDNPFVVEAPFVRFYAGMPLVLANGHAVGTLCMIDDRPRTLDATDLAIIGSLRDLVVEELQRRAGEADGSNEAAAE